MASHDSCKSIAAQYQGPWMGPETLSALPQLKRAYERNADPEREAMSRHMHKSEAQRRHESAAYEALKKSRASVRVKAIEQDNHSKRSDAEERGDSGRGEQSDGRGSSMIGKSRPRHVLRPPEHIARPVDQSAFKQAWMKEQRDAAFAQVEKHQNTTRETPEHLPGLAPRGRTQEM